MRGSTQIFRWLGRTMIRGPRGCQTMTHPWLSLASILRSQLRRRRQSLAFQNNLGDRVLSRVRDRKVDALRTELIQEPCGFARYIQRRHAVGVVNDLDILPRDLASPACF